MALEDPFFHYLLRMDIIAPVLLEAGNGAITHADCRAILVGCASFVAMHPVETIKNLFEVDQVSKMNSSCNYKGSSDYKDHNWQWILNQGELHKWYLMEYGGHPKPGLRFHTLATFALQKTKAIQLGHLMSKFMDLNDPHCRVGQVVAYWLRKLHVARGTPKEEFPDCLKTAYDLFVQWRGRLWSLLQVYLPLDNESLNKLGISKDILPFAYEDGTPPLQLGPSCNMGSRRDPNFRLIIAMLPSKKNSILNDYFHCKLNLTLEAFIRFQATEEFKVENEVSEDEIETDGRMWEVD